MVLLFFNLLYFFLSRLPAKNKLTPKSKMRRLLSKTARHKRRGSFLVTGERVDFRMNKWTLQFIRPHLEQEFRESYSSTTRKAIVLMCAIGLFLSILLAAQGMYKQEPRTKGAISVCLVFCFFILFVLKRNYLLLKTVSRWISHTEFGRGMFSFLLIIISNTSLFYNRMHLLSLLLLLFILIYIFHKYILMFNHVTIMFS